MSTTPRQLCEDVFLLLDRFKMEVRALADAHGLTHIQIYVLYLLHKHGDSMVMGKIAEAMHCDASNITGIVDRLVSGDFVVRKESERDRRAKCLCLTAKGAQVVNSVFGTLSDRVGCNLAPAERDQLHGLLQKLSM